MAATGNQVSLFDAPAVRVSPGRYELPTGNQRWTERQDTYRPPEERINPSEYDVAPIDSDNVARAFVLQHHYSASYPAARYRYGLYRRGELVGVAVYSQPSNNRTVTNPFNGGISHLEAVELGRFVLVDEVPGNGETWFLARCHEHLRRFAAAPKRWDHDAADWHGVRAVVSFSDPVPRSTLSGRLVLPGHVGTIYQATNAVYLGRGSRATLKLLPDGSVVNGRSLAKIRAHARGDTKRGSRWEGVVRQLVRAGAPQPTVTEGAELANWLELVLAELVRPLPHAGNHKYAWVLEGHGKGRTESKRRAKHLTRELGSFADALEAKDHGAVVVNAAGKTAAGPFDTTEEALAALAELKARGCNGHAVRLAYPKIIDPNPNHNRKVA